MHRYFRSISLACAVAVFAAPVSLKQASAHPHVFIDGAVDFIVDEAGALTGLSVTWKYDRFETLYVLTSIGIISAPDGSLSDKDRKTLIRNESDWPDSFDGAAHLTIDGDPVVLSGPLDLDAVLEDGHLTVRYHRDLTRPATISGRDVQVAFYERTYYYAFSVAEPPEIIGSMDDCMIDVTPFDATAEDRTMQATLAKLSREETPEDTNVGALFADRIALQCG